MSLPDAVQLVCRDPLFLMSNMNAGTVWERDRELLDLLGLHYVLLESTGPARSEASESDEHRIWVQHEQGARFYSSASHPPEYRQAFTNIAADGEIVSVGQYIARHSREAEIVAREYHAVGERLSEVQEGCPRR
ncbi:hypothetical protein ACFVQ0_11660 [Streptomyces sp. NPDC057900]|uniref:hypothetical protein n=1 Tax=Streptomyces sp. NPDC057900 TaxID=3346274 RepID=UPI0036E3473E